MTPIIGPNLVADARSWWRRSPRSYTEISWVICICSA